MSVALSDDVVEQTVRQMIGSDLALEYVLIFGTSRGWTVRGLGDFPAARLVGAAMEQFDGYGPVDLPAPTRQEEEIVARIDGGLHRMGEIGVGCIVCFRVLESMRYRVAWSAVVSEAEVRERLRNYLQCGLFV